MSKKEIFWVVLALVVLWLLLRPKEGTANVTFGPVSIDGADPLPVGVGAPVAGCEVLPDGRTLCRSDGDW